MHPLSVSFYLVIIDPVYVLRRAKAERESRIKAMQERAKKGLLSEEEKAVLAVAEAEKAERKDDCVIA